MATLSELGDLGGGHETAIGENRVENRVERRREVSDKRSRRFEKMKKRGEVTHSCRRRSLPLWDPRMETMWHRQASLSRFFSMGESMVQRKLMWPLWNEKGKESRQSSSRISISTSAASPYPRCTSIGEVEVPPKPLQIKPRKNGLTVRRQHRRPQRSEARVRPS